MTDEVTPSKGKREVSTIGFPYLDLNEAIAVARAMHTVGGVAMDRDQVAAALGQVPTSGSFAMKLSTARAFGLIDNLQGRWQITALGFEALDASREREARVQAFLNVPLYKKTYEEFRGRQLPPRPAGLERAFEQFGVSSKQTDKARQAFDRSARSAGFFPTTAEDRLVQPVLAPSELSVLAEPPPVSGADRTATRQQMAVYDMLKVRHPFIEGLLETLPDDKADWPVADRAKWLQAAAQIFDLLYAGGGDQITVEVRKGSN